MSTKRAADLTGLAVKGRAAPITPVGVKEAPVNDPAPPAAASAPDKKGRVSPAATGTTLRSMTVKLDNERFMILKTIGLKLGMTTQDILVDAFDDWADKQAAKSSQG